MMMDDWMMNVMLWIAQLIVMPCFLCCGLHQTVKYQNLDDW